MKKNKNWTNLEHKNAKCIWADINMESSPDKRQKHVEVIFK